MSMKDLYEHRARKRNSVTVSELHDSWGHCKDAFTRSTPRHLAQQAYEYHGKRIIRMLETLNLDDTIPF